MVLFGTDPLPDWKNSDNSEVGVEPGFIAQAYYIS